MKARAAVFSRAVWELVVTPMTPGQRQSSLLLVPLAVALLVHGAPDDGTSPVQVPAGAVAAAPARARTSAAVAASPSAPASASASAQLPSAGPLAAAGPSGRSSGAPRSSGSGSFPEAGSADAGSVISSTPPSVVALVRADDPLAGPRTERAYATNFLGASGVKATILAIGETGRTCADAVAAGSLIVVGAGLPSELRRCLAQAGATLLAHEEVREPGSGSLVSSRRSRGSALRDLLRHGLTNDLLRDRKVGVVSTEEARPVVEATLEAMAREGLRVVARSYQPEGPPVGRALANGVAAFAGAGVETTVFVAPAALQRDWVQQAAVLLPRMRYAASDAYDTVVDESYPVLFEGAVSVTSARVPWFERTHGPTREQAACRASWAKADSSPLPLDGAQLARLYTWCQHAALLAAALEKGRTEPAELRARRSASPLTADLGPVPDDGWGPVADAVLTWRASCACWTETRAFTARGTERRDQ